MPISNKLKTYFQKKGMYANTYYMVCPYRTEFVKKFYIYPFNWMGITPNHGIKIVFELS